MVRSRSCCTACPTTFIHMSTCPQLAAQGGRVIFPVWRPWPDPLSRRRTLRWGEQGALGADVIALLGALSERRRYSPAIIGAGVRPAWCRRCGPNGSTASCRSNSPTMIQDLARPIGPARPPI